MIQCNSFGWAYGELRAMYERGSFELYHDGKSFRVDCDRTPREYCYFTISEIEKPEVEYMTVCIKGDEASVLEAIEAIMEAYGCIDDSGYFDNVQGGLL